MSDDELFSAMVRATADRPLTGLTVLVVEDSRFACEALRLLCLRSGARIRRADSLRAARRHLSLYRPGAVLIDLGLPDGSGLDLIAKLARAHPKVDVILGISGDPDAGAAAERAGADGFIVKPILSLDQFQHAILSRMPQDAPPLGPRALGGETVQPDEAAFHDDLAQIADLLTATAAEDRLGYITQFLEVLAVQAGDKALRHAADRLRRARETGQPWGPDLARLAGLVQERLDRRQVV
ncbi:response regulator [Frigidibacter sp. ROC022]|uniref:response regulator n=1 Tax=Frigidibacter sp. ROC022 TaxID=2971796 RepID=UPI00215AA202|nr:response regulator [Frigidibacter sp. ROC022]MCR8726243.1 response regulator [Frigidibacter sp. ROC022]